MAEIVNLRSARKRRQREGAEAVASQNRIRHGLSKAARDTARIESQRTDAVLEGHRLTDPGEPNASGDQ